MLAAAASLLRRRPAPLHTAGLHVVAWGRNVEGQCGVEDSSPLITCPTSLLNLHGAPVTQLVAGKLASAAVLGTGEALTFGCGKSGKLGHGNAEQLSKPARVEALVGRADITAVSLGDSHSLFLDQLGGMWSCGENKDGQCGLEALLQSVAAQHHRHFQPATKHTEAFRGFAQQKPASDKFERFLQQSLAASTAAPQPRPRKASWQHHMRSAWATTALGVAGGGSNAAGRLHQLAAQASGGGGSGVQGLGWLGHGAGTAGMSSPGLWGFDLDSHMTASGLQAGQRHTPARIGSMQQCLASLGAGGIEHPAAAGAAEACGAAAGASTGGLEGQRVVGCAASRYYSVVVTDRGEVWTFGAEFDASLSTGSSGSSTAKPIAPELAAAIKSHGGAVAVAAGTSFVICLTASGTALGFGRLGLGAVKSTSEAADGRAVWQVQGLPPITSIAVGHQHALLSDGERVWAIGRWMSADGEEAGCARPERPQEMLHLPAEGVAKVAAGAHASAAVSGDGRLYMWGRLVDSLHAEGLVRRFGADIMSEDVDWKWAGWGGAEPSVVEGLEGVQDVAIGGWHALASLK